MLKDDFIRKQGEVPENPPNATFQARWGNGHVVTGHISG
mgnify:FL=1|jgi:translation initiation factor IF-1